MNAELARLRKALQMLLGRRRPEGEAGRRQLAAVLRSHRAWLHSPNVVGIGIALRRCDGRLQPEPVLSVRVAQKMPATALGDDLIPAAIRLPGIARPVAVDVVQGTVLEAQDACCGDAIAPVGLPDWGTIGCLVVHKDEPARTLLLTCAHVLPAATGSDVEWLGHPGAPTSRRRVLARLKTRTKLRAKSPGDPYPNLYEIALADPGTLAIGHRRPGLGVPRGIRTSALQMGDSLKLFGATSGRLDGAVTDVAYNGDMRLNGVVHGFRDLVLYSAPTRGGDSGAAVLDAQDRLVGLHMGVEPGGDAALMPIAPIFDRYGLALAPADAAPSAGSERALAIDTLARTIWGEARGEPADGRQAVANVVMNRVRRQRPGWGLTVADVCRRKSQFSCWNPGDPNRAKLLAVGNEDAVYRAALALAQQAVNGSLPDLTLGSCHYHADNIVASWAPGHQPVRHIGRHLFYNDVP